MAVWLCKPTTTARNNAPNYQRLINYTACCTLLKLRIMNDNIIYEFLYNSDCCESAASTMSLHKTRKGAEMAMEFHKAEKKREYNELYDDEYRADFDWDFDQWWGIRETPLNE